MIVSGGVVVGGLFAGAWIFNRGLKIGADIVWKVSEKGGPLFEPPTELSAATTEDNDNDILTEEEQNEET